MHRLPSQSSVRRFRVAAWLLLLKWLFFGSALGLFGYAILKENREAAFQAMFLTGLAVVVSAGHWIAGTRARCPLCLVPSFSHQQCSKHRKAMHFLGSYRLFVALAVAFKGYYHCPYCGEPTAIKVRERHRGFRF